MKKIIISITLSITFLFSTTAFAAGEDGLSTVDPGITPDSILYPVDKLLEDTQLLLTTDTEKVEELLSGIADERLAEAEVMTEENKTEEANEAFDGYLEIISATTGEVSETPADENTAVEAEEEAQEATDETTLENPIGEQEEATADTLEDMVIPAKFVKGMDAKTVVELRQAGLGFGQIAQIALLSEQTGKTVEEVAALYKEGKGFGTVTKMLGLHPSQVKKHSNKSQTPVVPEEGEETSEPAEAVIKEEASLPEGSEDASAAVEKLGDEVQALTSAPAVTTDATEKAKVKKDSSVKAKDSKEVKGKSKKNKDN